MFYLLLINLFSLFVMGLDKRKAIKKQYRISELSFFLLAIIGGSLGIILGMLLFHHKTKKVQFVWGIPLIILIQLIIIIII